MFFERPESLPAFAVFHLIIHIVAYYRAARPLAWGSDDYCEDTLFQSAAPRNFTNLSKSSKSFFIYIYLFYLSRFVRFLCREAHSYSRLRRVNLSKSSILHKLDFIYFSCDFVAVIPFRIQTIRTEIYQHTIR